MPATFTGPVSYHSHDDALYEDGDYNLLLVPKDKAALTTGDTDWIKVEFKDDETVDRFVTPFWTSGEFGSLSGNYAIVTGLLGLDSIHDFSTELHPAYLVAIRTRDPDPPRGVPERWAFFVRNWGNEGMCSHSNWEAELKLWVFKVPWRPSAKSVRIEKDVHTRNSGSAYDIRPVKGDGIFVAVYLGELSEKNVVHGEIALYWDESGAPAARVLPQNPQRPSIGARPVAIGDAAQERLDQAIARMPAESKARFAATVGARKITPSKDEEKVVRRPMTFSIPTASIWTGPARNTLLQPVEDTAAVERTKRMVQALCEAYRGNVPQFPKLCQKR